MKVAILGYGLEGQASARYFADRGDDIVIHDGNTGLQTPANIATVLGDKYLDDLDKYDLLVRSPGIYPGEILTKNPGIETKITTQTNEFMRICPSKNVIGVTGTKGKGTTSSLIAKMLEAVGQKVHLGGNIGVPAFDLREKGIAETDWVVLELSNFQLIDLHTSPHIGVCLMMASEHLDWHPNQEDYYKSKTSLFRHQGPDDIAVYFAQNELSKQIAGNGYGQKIPYYEPPGAYIESGKLIIEGQTICSTDEIKLLGQHNWQNACAAVTVVWQIAQNIDALRQVLITFAGLEHRLEYLRELNGVSYYNDSFGTTPETAIVAIQSFDQPKAVILGGSEKHSDYTELIQIVSSAPNTTAILIGDMADKLKNLLDQAGSSNYVYLGPTTTQQYLDEARKVAEQYIQKDISDKAVVLLSTACASFDMYKNYKDRGNQFKQAVQELA